MTDARPPLAKLATDALAAERVQTPEPSPVHRARAIALLAATIETEARVRRRRRWAIALGAAAVAAGAIVAVGSLRRHGAPTPVATTTTNANGPQISGSAHALSGDVEMVHEGRETKLDATAAIAPGDHVLAANDARAAVTLSTGTHLVIEGGGDLAVVEQDATQIYSLQSGAVQADVAKLTDGQRFIVRTRDAEIEVRGTSFELSVVVADASCGGGTTTRLIVAEGVVVVRAGGSETKVAAGDKWPAGCDGNDGATSTAAASTATTAEAPAATGAAKETKESALAAQNDLFAQATAKKNAGDGAGAIAAYEKYLAKYPGGALAENATVERMRLLSSIDAGRAATAAKAYLARYPKGFARVEAERLAAEAP